jgi:transposase
VSGRPRNRGERKPQSASPKAPEELVASFLAGGFRKSEERDKLRRATQLSDEQIERALLSPKLDALLRDVRRAWAREQWPALLRSLFDAARQGQSWAWRVLLEATGIGEELRAATAARAQDDGAAFISTDYERRLIEDLRRGGEPVAPPGPGPSASG